MPRGGDPPERDAPVDDAGGAAIRVFICYAHDSEEHKLLVRRFVEFIRAAGIDARMDAWDTPHDQAYHWKPG